MAGETMLAQTAVGLEPGDVSGNPSRSLISAVSPTAISRRRDPEPSGPPEQTEPPPTVHGKQSDYNLQQLATVGRLIERLSLFQKEIIIIC